MAQDRILVVDDEETIALVIQGVLEEKGLDVVTAHSAEQALARVAADEFAVVLTDIVMPGMSGYQAKRKLAADESTAHIPVIFVSTRGEETDQIWGLRQGAAAYITKPVNPELLLSAISAAVAA